MKADSAIPTVPIFGIRVSKVDMKTTVSYLTEAVHNRVPHQVITANPIMVMAALENPSYMEIMKSAELVVPDGTGVVWAADYCKEPVAERVAGFDLYMNYCARVKATTGEYICWAQPRGDSRDDF